MYVCTYVCNVVVVNVVAVAVVVVVVVLFCSVVSFKRIIDSNCLHLLTRS